MPSYYQPDSDKYHNLTLSLKILNKLAGKGHVYASIITHSFGKIFTLKKIVIFILFASISNTVGLSSGFLLWYHHLKWMTLL